MATTDKKKEVPEHTITVQVAKRKSIDHDGVLYGPGAKLSMAVSDAKALHANGFIVQPDDDDEAEAEAEAAGDASGPTVQTEGQDQ